MKTKLRKARETRAAYKVRTVRPYTTVPRANKPLPVSPRLPKGPSWQKLEAWRAWKKKHIQEFEREFPGRYLAIWEKKIIATGSTWGEAFDNAHLAKSETVPWITYIPTSEEMNLVPILA